MNEDACLHIAAGIFITEEIGLSTYRFCLISLRMV